MWQGIPPLVLLTLLVEPHSWESEMGELDSLTSGILMKAGKIMDGENKKNISLKYLPLVL